MNEMQDVIIRAATADDVDVILAIAAQMERACDVDYYRFAFGIEAAGEREVFLAEVGGKVAGFVMLNHAPKYKFFKLERMSEIQDLNVLSAERSRGIGSALLTHCEDIIRVRGGQQIGIGVGLTESYGAAQRLYAKRGYVPDGFGVTYDRRGVRAGEVLPVDDEMSLMMVKNL